MQLRKILCPVDLSDNSRSAMQFAIELANRAHAPLELVNVWESPPWATSNLEPGLGVAIQQMIDSDSSTLERWADEARRAGVASVTCEFLQGVPWERIVDVAKRDPAIDLIVMGTHGRTGLKAALIGSVAEKVARHAPCRVLVTRERGQ